MPKAYIHLCSYTLPPNLHCGLHDNMAPHLNSTAGHLERNTQDRRIPTVSTYLHCQMLSSLLAHAGLPAESPKYHAHWNTVQRNGLFWTCLVFLIIIVTGLQSMEKWESGNTIMARGAEARHPVASSRGPASGNGLPWRAWASWLNQGHFLLSSRFLVLYLSDF